MNTVSILKCKSYEYEHLKTAMIETVNNLGGFEKYIDKGETVLLKINLVMKKLPEYAVTTNPIFVQILAEMLIEYGAKVIIGDSPGGPFNEKILKSLYSVCKITEASEKSGATLNFNTKSSEVQNPKGMILKKLINADMIRDADKVISVAKLKTHGMMKMTGAVKNMFGTIPGTIKAEYHLNCPQKEDFADALIDVCICSNPVLSFIDGITAMEGDGPTSGVPRHVGAILASPNPYDLDFVAAQIINTEPLSVPIIKQSIKRGLSANSIKDINIVGDKVNDFVVKDFIVPDVKEINPLNGKIPKFASRLISRSLQPRPIFIHEKCTGCGDCFDNCPPKAIEMVAKRPTVKIEKCIRCFCCQELCSRKTVEIYRPPLLRIISKLS